MSDFVLHDSPASWLVQQSRVIHDGHIEQLRVDTICSPDGGEGFERDVIGHVGSVAVLALNDADEVLLVRQYRHPVGAELVEIPAGLRDEEGEPAIDTARRELREEGFAEADSWSPLCSMLPSPGISDEQVQIFRASGATVVGEAPGFTMEHEEASMTRAWVPFDDLLDAVLDGRIGNAITCLAVTMEAARRARGHQDADN